MVMDAGSAAPQHEQHPAGGGDVAAHRRLDSPQCAEELLAIVAYVTSADGPLQDPADPEGHVSPWRRRLLHKASERLDVVDAYMRGRIAFLVAGRDRGYHAPENELELAGTVLDTCRATTSVVEALLAGRLPTSREFETMSSTALAINPALDAVRALDERPDDR
jgi:hypothetical protein